MLNLWIKNPERNPYTNKPIKLDGFTYKKLLKLFNYDPHGRVKKKVTFAEECRRKI